MVVRERWRVHQFIRAGKAIGGPTLICQLPVSMADRKQYPGADSYVLAAVYCYDGKAMVVPPTLRCGILLCDWSLFMAYLRRRRDRQLGRTGLTN